jgi:tRNA 5-methylaminomethyl-2-thiouridine biosynthesis bifunctional protein
VRFGPITPARIAFGDGPPQAPDFGDVYHARAGALAQARHVFLGGNGLPQRWQRRARFVVLETGFGLGHNFLATWDAWRADAQRCARLCYVAIDKHPPTRADLARAHAGSPLPALAQALVDAWPPLTPDLHALAFDGGRVLLRLAFGDVAAWLPQLRLDADAVYLDGFAPDRNPAMWQPRVLKALAGRVAPGATAATWSVAREVRDGLASAGFVVERAPGLAGKREMSVAQFRPAYTPRRRWPPARVAPAHALVVGAGLAGAAAAQALAAAGWPCTVYEAAPAPALAASGNAGGLFHGSVAPDDGVPARALRAAALAATAAYRPLLAAGALPGQAEGLLQRVDDAPLAALRERLARLGLPADYAEAIDAAQASARAGVALRGGAWWFHAGGGWLAPPALAAHWLAQPGVELRCGTPVQALRRGDAGWQLLGRDGRVLAAAETVVLAAAADTPRLLAAHGAAGWPLQSSRGQVTLIDAAGWPRPRLPLAGEGYAIALPDGRLLCGATRHAADDDAQLRASDHTYNLARLARLLDLGAPPGPAGAALAGRVGWRLAVPDRLPLVGAVPGGDGLYVCTALGARGITWAPLAGALIAAHAAGEPFPLDARGADALAPARCAAPR